MLTEIVRVGPDDASLVDAAADLLDGPVVEDARDRFLTDDRHHLLVAMLDGTPVGFVSGVETTHPDKGTEMLLYELSVADEQRRRGIGSDLVRALAALAAERGCYGMWVLTDDDNAAAVSTYGAAGATSTGSQTLLEWRFSP
jgi:ribosomal protein S18 acetylase RimI-like enzyme